LLDNIGKNVGYTVEKCYKSMYVTYQEKNITFKIIFYH
jgi:hypothetical protein